VIPAVLCVLLVVFGVEEPKKQTSGSDHLVRSAKAKSGLSGLTPKFWVVVAAASALTLARFSEAFLILRAADLGVQAAYAPLVLAGMSVVYAVTAYPAGRLADRMAPQTLLAAGIAVLVAADVVLALAPNVATLAVGIALWGLHMGSPRDCWPRWSRTPAPADLRGTAFGVFNLAMGLAMLLASADRRRAVVLRGTRGDLLDRGRARGGLARITRLARA
jgi:MFS family permease